MEIKTTADSFFVFDLDDTLYEEIEFLKSAYHDISAHLLPYSGKDIYTEMYERYQRQENVFGWIVERYREVMPELDLKMLLQRYRDHVPEISLSPSTRVFLDEIKRRNIGTGLITDGRSLTQRNKLKALGIEEYFDDIVISEEFGSEKPNEKNYRHFEAKYPGKSFYFFGDNTSKDFIVPIKLGWTIFCLESIGNHVHLQSLGNFPNPENIISSFQEVQFS